MGVQPLSRFLGVSPSARVARLDAPAPGAPRLHRSRAATGAAFDGGARKGDERGEGEEAGQQRVMGVIGRAIDFAA